MSERERVNVYLETVARLEPDIAPVDASAFYASAAISLKRIADHLTRETDDTLRNCIAKAVIDRSGLHYNIASEIARLALEYYKGKSE